MALFVWPSAFSGLATEATLLLIESAVDGLEALVTDTNSKLDTLNAKDFATETTVDAVKTLVTNRLSGSFVPEAYDYMSYASGASDDTYVFKSGGSGGTTVKTVVVTYTDSSKTVISNVAAT